MNEESRKAFQRETQERDRREALKNTGAYWREDAPIMDAQSRAQKEQDEWDGKGTVQESNDALDSTSKFLVSMAGVQEQPPIEPPKAESQQDDNRELPQAPAPSPEAASQAGDTATPSVVLGDTMSPQTGLETTESDGQEDSSQEPPEGSVPPAAPVTPQDTPKDIKVQPGAPPGFSRKPKGKLEPVESVLPGSIPVKIGDERAKPEPPPPAADEAKKSDKQEGMSKQQRMDFLKNGGRGFVPPFLAGAFKVNDTDNSALEAPAINRSDEVGQFDFAGEEIESAAQTLVGTLQRLAEAAVMMQNQLNEINEVLDRSFGS